ncbi:hypothetical protein LRAMOSA08658 [Lichtheimia ramosa]|uniref:Uncharacterized protein n=1 Tax=Lichtheimia ramosa TaxID=688394 RepID=A0A077WFD2_9FUNG|nr:hypothetical protein LRAMOSA08658 [Lichtheimia ramosa]
MVCLGPRKKPAKKPQLLSPDDATKTRSVKTKRSLIGTRKSTATTTGTTTTANNATATTKTSNRRSVASRASLESTASARKTAAASARSPSPRPRSPATRPQAPPPGTAPSIRSNARPTSMHSRHPSTASSVRKSPVAQLREEYDELKVKNTEHLQLIAQQEEELKRLKEQLEKQQQQPEKKQEENEPTSSPPTPQPELKASFSQLEFDTLQQQNEENVTRLHAKEQELEDREKELRQLREQLEKDKTPSIVVTDDLAERERILQEREKALEEQRQKWEAEQSQSKIEDAAAQLEKLKLENEEAVKRLAAKEKELEQLRNHGEKDSAQLEQIEQLNKQLEAEKQAHEESMRRHEEALAEKDALLSEQKKALDHLQEMHEEQVRSLKTEQSSSILSLKQRHKEDMSNLQARLKEAETKLKNSSNAEMMEDEIERILKEFEQAEHTHAVQIESLEQSHQSELSDMQQNHATQIKNLRKQQDQNQKKWTTRYLPTEAVSWPAPQPLSKLRKTNGPNARPSAATRIASAAQRDDNEPVLTPLDTKKVQVYISTVSGNAVIKRKQEEMIQLLKTNNIQYELVDVASSEAALQYMKRCNNNGSNEGRAKEVPQLFVGGEYRGQFEDVSKSVEENTLETLLQPAAERQWTEEEKAAIQKAEARKKEQEEDPTNAPPIRVLPPGPVEMPTLRKTSSIKPGPVRAYRGEEDDDDALLKELENEIKAGKVDIADI